MFIGTAMADGDMGSGGRTCPENCPPPEDPFTQNQNGTNGNKEESDIFKLNNEERARIFIEVLMYLNRLF